MSKKKLSPEAELEKLYQDYKAQFEDWKIKNREAYGTDAYIHYVKQFEIWEEDVEKRRISLRNKAEQERKAQLEAEKLQREKDEAAALAYAEEQSSYMAMHIQQRVIQDEHMAAAAARNVSSKQYNNYSSPQISNRGIPTVSNSNTLPNHQQTTTTTQLSVESKTHGPPPANEFNSMANVMQQMLNFAMNAEKSKDSAKNKSSSTNAPPSTSNTSLANTTTTTTNSSLDSSNAPPPQLWGKDGTQFLPTDPMFLRWGFRAAPTNFAMAFQAPPPSTITEYWLTLKALKENQLIALANEHPPPPPPHLAIPHHHLQQQQQPIPLNSFHSVHPIGVGDSLLSYNIPPPNLNIPPPQSFYRTA